MIKKEDELDLKVLIFNYIKYWPWILASVFTGCFGAFIINKYSTSIYRVESTVLVKEDNPTLGADLFASAGFGQEYSNLDNEIGILKSYSMAEATVSSMDLNVQYFLEGLIKTSQIYGKISIYVNPDWTKPQLIGGMFRLEVLDAENFELSITEQGFSEYDPKDPYNKKGLGLLELPKSVYAFGDTIQIESYDFTVNQISALPGEVIFFQFRDTPSLASEMRGRLNVVSPDKYSSSILTLSVETPLPKLGEDYLNQLMKTYLQRELDEKNRTTENTIRFITSQLSGITDSLQFSENKLQRYRSENRIFNLSEEGSAIFEQLQQLEKEKVEMELNLKYYQILQNYINSNQMEDLAAPSMIGVTDPLLNAMVENFSELQAEKNRLSANFSEQTPRVKDVNTRLESAKKALQENVSSAISNTRTTLSDLNTRIRSIERQISTLPETERNLIGIQRQFTINENIYIYLLQKKAEAEITLASNLPKNTILDYAKTGGLIGPKRTQNLLFGLILGLLIPIALITVKDYLNHKIEDPKELENEIKVPLIGMIGRNNTETSLPVFDSPRSTITESFRSLRADLSYLSSKRNNLAILFTSAISGEGKTFVSLNMAAVFALMGKKTILIGLDLRKPKIAEEFGLTNDKGMSTCLSLETPWQEVVKASGHKHLDIILSGPIPPNPAELLLQESFGKIIKEIKQEYDVVIFDCPPVGLVSEAKELFTYSDINFYVFRQGFSEKTNTQILNNLVTKGGVSKIYGILNDVHIDSGYGYGYGYSYGYGYGSNSYGYNEETPLPWWKRALRIKK